MMSYDIMFLPLEELLSQGFPPDAPVVIYQLRKEYPGSGGAPPQVAVHSVSIAIQRNECFGLLGPNGAGKTTLISVLTGLYEPTRGTARIAGYDITTEVLAILLPLTPSHPLSHSPSPLPPPDQLHPQTSRCVSPV